LDSCLFCICILCRLCYFAKMTLLKRLLTPNASIIARSRRSFSSQLSTPSPEEVARRNAIVGLSLLGFVVSVFYYTVTRMKVVADLGPEFDEKLNAKKDCETCEPAAAKKA
jgi:hypothetical protein